VLDERLKNLMQELGNAINESLSESERIAAAIGEIRRTGYDVFLVLEATIGFNKREADGDEADSERSEVLLEGEMEASGKFRWNSQDQKFLKALKIAVDDDGNG